MNSYLINASTSLILAEPSSIVYLSTLNTPGVNITIRDYTGLVSSFSTIIVSTTDGTKFIDGNTRYLISSPYGYLTVQSVNSNTWSLVNSFNTGVTARSVDILSTKKNTITSTLFGDSISSLFGITSSIGIDKLNPRFQFDISGYVNADNIYQNSNVFTLGGNIDFIRTSSLNIGNTNLFPSTNFMIGGAKIFSQFQASIPNNTANIMILNSQVNVNSTLWITSSGRVGINTSSISSLYEIKGTTTVNSLSFPFPTGNLSTLIESSYPNYSSFFINSSTAALVTDLITKNQIYSTVSAINVNNGVFINGRLSADRIGINQTNPTSQLHTSNTVNTSSTVRGASATFTNTFVSSMAVGRSNASTLLDVSGNFITTTGYFSTIGVRKIPAYTLDVNGSLNVQQLLINNQNINTAVFIPSSLSVSSIQTFGTESNYFLQSTFFNGPTFTNSLQTSTITSGEYRSFDINSFANIVNSGTESNIPSSLARYDITNYTTANGTTLSNSVSGSTWPNATLLQGTLNTLTTASPRYVTIYALPPDFPSQTGGIHIGSNRTFRSVEMWIRLRRFSSAGQVFFDFRGGLAAGFVVGGNPSVGSAIVGTTYYTNTISGVWQGTTDVASLLFNAGGWVQFVQTFNSDVTDTPTLFTRFDDPVSFAFVQGMPVDVADVAFYSETLTTRQIQDLYNSKCSRYSLPTVQQEINVPQLSIENLFIYGKNPIAPFQSTNFIHSQISSLTFNSSLFINQPNTNKTTNTIINGFTRVENLFAESSLSIRNSTAITLFDVQLPSTSGVFSNFPITRGSVNDSNASTLLTTVNTWASFQALPQSNTTNLGFYFRGGSSGNSNYRVSYAFTNTLFTGQHANLSVDSRVTPSTLTQNVGLITSSADDGYYSILPDGRVVEDQEAIWITEALPKIKLTDTDMDSSVWGIITNHQNEAFTPNGKPELDYQTSFTSPLEGRIRINGIGEGAMWVTNINGTLENGDYICSSIIPGYGRKQDDDQLHSYTVAKATMSCAFELNQSKYICKEFVYNNKTYRKAFIGCTYHCS